MFMGDNCIVSSGKRDDICGYTQYTELARDQVVAGDAEEAFMRTRSTPQFATSERLSVEVEKPNGYRDIPVVEGAFRDSITVNIADPEHYITYSTRVQDSNNPANYFRGETRFLSKEQVKEKVERVLLAERAQQEAKAVVEIFKTPPMESAWASFDTTLYAAAIAFATPVLLAEKAMKLVDAFFAK